MLFGARAELEGEREELVYGPPRNQQELTDRVIAALAERAAATAATANDRPVQVDLGHAPADPAGAADGLDVVADATPRPEPQPQPAAIVVTVTDEQRRQWRELIARSVAARRVGERDASDAVEAQRQALITQLGPERVALLRAESHQNALQGLQRRRERLRLTAQWQTRPHSRLTDAELTQAIRHTERQQTEHQTAADHARHQLTEQEQAVAAGSGPRIARLDTELRRLRVNAELQATIEALERRWQDSMTQIGEAAAQAADTRFAAERTRWWQPGRRERLQAETIAHQALVEQTRTEAVDLARHAAELQEQLGGPRVWRLARQQAERAEASYQRDRQRAHQTDHTDLTSLRDRVTSHDAAALAAGTRHDELVAEQDLRTSMSAAQRSLEHQMRTLATQQQIEQTTPEHQLERSAHADLDYQQRSIQPNLHRDIDRGGPSLSL